MDRLYQLLEDNEMYASDKTGEDIVNYFDDSKKVFTSLYHDDKNPALRCCCSCNGVLGNVTMSQERLKLLATQVKNLQTLDPTIPALVLPGVCAKQNAGARLAQARTTGPWRIVGI